MSRGKKFLLMLFAVAITVPAPALAYTGPGLGMGAISVALGVLGSIFLGIVAVIWYPIKRALRALRSGRSKPSTEQEPSQD